MRLPTPFRLTAISGLCLTVWLPHSATAQTPSPAATTPTETVVITANPLGSARIGSPSSVLTGDELVIKRGSSLGETLGDLPGVASTYFGPNANRPVVRGLDGDRVRILSNSGASLDASSLSFDHAVPIDPLIITRLEVLRGPGALFYGGSAIGGVVNAIDNRIPRDRLDRLTGSAEIRLGGTSAERGGAAIIESGNGALAWHVDWFGRDSADLRVPVHVPIEDGSPLPATNRVRNSASQTRGGAIGASLFIPAGRLGVSVDSYDSRYGVVAEPDVTIQMRRYHLGLAGELMLPAGPVSKLHLNANFTDYQHQEIAGDGAVGTTFKSRGSDLRVEAEHRPMAGALAVRGVLGLQLEDFDFSALGVEAFVPSTRTRKAGVFALEEMAWPGGLLSAGLRLENARVASHGDEALQAGKFGPARQRSFALRSLSLSNALPLTTAWSLSSAWSATQRAPTYFELFANGVHAATGVYESGDATLPKERSSNIDIALQWKTGIEALRIGAFRNRFARFISLDASGAQVDDSGAVVPAGTPGSLPLYRYGAARASLHGLELEAKTRLLTRPWTLDASATWDATRATNLDSGEPLPRIAPRRLKLALDAAQGPWTLRAELDSHARQARVPRTDQATQGHSELALAMTRTFALQGSDALWFLKLANVGNQLAYSASSIQTIRGLSPLPGRSLKTGLRVAF